jgi:hypothetical protein
MDSILDFFRTRINTDSHGFFSLISSRRPLGPTPRREEIHETQCARGAQVACGEKAYSSLANSLYFLFTSTPDVKFYQIANQSTKWL